MSGIQSMADAQRGIKRRKEQIHQRNIQIHYLKNAIAEKEARIKELEDEKMQELKTAKEFHTLTKGQGSRILELEKQIAELSEQVRKYKNEWESACERERGVYPEREANQKELLRLNHKCAELEMERAELKSKCAQAKDEREMMEASCILQSKTIESQDREKLELTAMVGELRKALESMQPYWEEDAKCGCNTPSYDEAIIECEKALSLTIPDPSCLSREIEKAVKPLVDGLNHIIKINDWCDDDREYPEPNNCKCIYHTAKMLLAQFTKSEQVAGPGVADYERIVGQMSKSEEGKRK